MVDGLRRWSSICWSVYWDDMDGAVMEQGFKVVTTPQLDGKITQEMYAVNYDVREQIMIGLLDTQEQQIRDALIALG